MLTCVSNRVKLLDDWVIQMMAGQIQRATSWHHRMGNYLEAMPKVNPDILRWARETVGLSPEDAAKKLDIKDARGIAAKDRLLALERGEHEPSRAMIVKMAKRYRQPLVLFYMNKIPPRGDLGEDFRTLPESVDQIQEGLVDTLVCDIGARQSLVRDCLEEANEDTPLPFIGSMRPDYGVQSVIASIMTTINFDRDAFRDKPDLRSAFAYLRERAETAGIYVILVDNLGSWHTTISVEAFRGFALADEIAPFVAINANDSPGAWSFTLVHELAHLWIGASGLSGGTGDKGIEKFCNDVAGEFLLSRDEVAEMDIAESTPFGDALSRIAEFARSRNVSNTMVAYMLQRSGAFSFAKYQEFKAAFRKNHLDRKAADKIRNVGKNVGPDYYSIRKHRNGSSLIRLVDQMLHEGIISVTKAGTVLGAGAQNVFALLERGRSDHSM